MMRVLWELTKRSLQRHLTYRTAAIAGLLTNFFFGPLRAAILIALYDDRGQVAGITVQGAVTYAALTQVVIGYLSIFRWTDLMDSIYSGEVATALLKPLNLFSFWLAQDLGRAIANLLLRGFAILLIFALVFDLTYPASPQGWLALLLAVVLSWLVSFSWRFLANLAAFWTPDATGVLRLAFVMSWFFSGFILPLRYFPDWVNRIAYLTPFPHMLNTVVEVYLGLLDGPELAWALLNQALWGIGLILAGQWILRAGVRRLVVLGG